MGIDEMCIIRHGVEVNEGAGDDDCVPAGRTMRVATWWARL